MSIIKKDGVADEEGASVAQEKAKSSQQSAAVSKTKLASRAFSDAAKSNEARGDRESVDRAKEAELRGNENPRSWGFEGDEMSSYDGSSGTSGELRGDDEGDGGDDGDGKSGSSSGGGPAPELDLGTSDYTSFADMGSGEVMSRKDQKAVIVKAEQQKAKVESSPAQDGPKEIKVTKADGTTITMAAPASAKSGAPAAALAAAKPGAAPVVPGKSGGGGKGGGGAPSGPG